MSEANNPQEPRSFKKSRNARRTELKRLYKLRESQLADSLSGPPTANDYLTGAPSDSQSNNIHLTGKKPKINKNTQNPASMIPSFNQNNYIPGNRSLNMPGPSMVGPNMAGPSMVMPNMAGPSMFTPNTPWPNMAGPGSGGPDMAGANMAGPNMFDPYMANAGMPMPYMSGPNMPEPNITVPYMTEPIMVGPNMAKMTMSGPNLDRPNLVRPNMNVVPLQLGSQPQKNTNNIPLTSKQARNKLKREAYLARYFLRRKEREQANAGHHTPNVHEDIRPDDQYDPLNQENMALLQKFMNQPKKKKKVKKPQPPKKEKCAPLTPEQQYKRYQDMKMIEQKYKQAVFVHRLVANQPKPEPPPKKPKAKVAPQPKAQPVQPQKQGQVTKDAAKSQSAQNPKQEPGETVVTEQVKQNVNNTAPAQYLPLFPTAPKRKRIRSKKNKNQNNQYNQANVYMSNQANPASSSQYQAPHQDEPEDLTDDLAPNMGQGGQAGSQARTVVAENKLNFKFQRSVPKNTDWSEYQNKFRRIGGGSPGPDPGPGEKEIKQEPNETNTGSNDNKPSTQSTTTAASVPRPTITVTMQNTGANKASQPTAAVQQPQTAPQKPAASRFDVKPSDAPQKPVSRFDMKPMDAHQKPVSRFDMKPTDIPQKPVSRFDVMHKPAVQKASDTSNPNLIDVRYEFRQTNQPPEPHPPHPYQIFGPYDNYPKGIPKSFLRIEKKMDPPKAPQQVPLPEPSFPGQDQGQGQGQAAHIDLPSWILGGGAPHEAPREPAPTARPYSPTDVYLEATGEEDPHEGSESPDLLQSSHKRQSAFSRLGPLAQPKKPKLTINLTLNKEQAVREVVDETDADFRYVPVHLRKDILQSSDQTVKKYLPFWPWKKNLPLRKTVSARHSKSVMILEQEQMESGYEKDSVFIQVSVKGYPLTWSKEDVLDAILDCVKGKHFIPCFVEFTPNECKFLVIRCRSALIAIHKVGFCIRKADVELTVSISLTDASLNQIDLIPRLVLRRRLMLVYDGESALDLNEFCVEKDVSHFVYYPLNRVTNQLELVQLQSAVGWEYLTELNLSRNRITSLDGFDLCKTTPRLKRLDLSHNLIDRLPALLPLRALPLRALWLEGNPLCHDYIDAAHYVKVARMLFSELRELDGVRITLKGSFPPMRRNYCPSEAAAVADKFLETFFPLLEAGEDRAALENLYHKDAVLTITFRHKLLYGTTYRYFRSLFARARSVEGRELESVVGAPAIAALLARWPALEHDRYSITVDVIYHDDFTTIIRIGGVLKLTAESLAEDEHLLSFARTVALRTRNGAQYKIHNEMLYWDTPREEVAKNAFNITTVRPRRLTVKLESPPDEDLKSKLIEIFVKIAEIDKKRGARCLERKNWDLRSALEYYMSLLKLDNLSALSAPKESTPVPQAS